MNSQINLAVDPVIRAHPRTLLCIEANASIREAMALLRDACRGCLLVCRDQQMAGIFTERDALRVMALETDVDRPVESVMQSPVVSVEYDVSVGEAITRMLRGGYRRLPVLSGSSEPIGILTMKTILHYLVDHFPSVVYTLPPEPHYATHLREGA
ncbi:MAG: CBS domain-containing protein [Planctomycetota bacterium]|nr:CBS domain-containing protein [Planctomycetota bacterium]